MTKLIATYRPDIGFPIIQRYSISVSFSEPILTLLERLPSQIATLYTAVPNSAPTCDLDNFKARTLTIIYRNNQEAVIDFPLPFHALIYQKYLTFPTLSRLKLQKRLMKLFLVLKINGFLQI